MKIVIKESQYNYLVEQTTNSGTTTSTTITPVKLSREEQIKLNKEKLELKKKAAEELKLKTIQKKDSIAKAWKEKRAPELKKAEEIHKKYVDAWLKNNPGKTEADYVKYLEKQKKLPNAPSCDTQDPDFSHTKCGVSKSASKEERRSWSKR
jgi:outer membrane protein assembly factor BamD (BamD/ComL family)